MPSTFVWIVDGREFLASPLPSSSIFTVATALTAHLSDSERKRLQRFLKPQRACEFLLGRLLLRHALTQVLGCSTADIDVTERPGASPQVTVVGRQADGPALPGFSLSHSRGWAVCALNEAGSIGVDIEVPAPQRDLPALAQATFAAQEIAWLNAQTHYESAFYRLWCTKEALYKFRHNTGLPEPQAYAMLDCETGAPTATDAFLHHESTAHYQLCLCSAVRPEHQIDKRLDCKSLLNLLAA